MMLLLLFLLQGDLSKGVILLSLLLLQGEVTDFDIVAIG